MTVAETLRRAAARMRSEPDRREFWEALAGLLETEAEAADRRGPRATPEAGVLEVARAYLGTGGEPR